MDKLTELILAINSNNPEQLREDKEELYNCFNCFIDYFNHVVSMEAYVKTHPEINGMNEFMLKKMDEERRGLHDLCINACKKINFLCDKYKSPQICEFDLNNRQKVAELVAVIVTKTYMSGIKTQKTFDELVEDFSSNNTQISRLEY